MSVQSKKKKSPSKPKSINKKKPGIKKSTVKPKKRKQKKKRNLKRSILILFPILLMSFFVAFGFYLGKNSDKLAAMIEKGEIEGAYTTKNLLEDLARLKVDTPKETEHSIKPKVKKTVPHRETNEEVIVAKKVVVEKAKREKLAIIIDDVSKKSQINAIKATGMKLTPAIFPPSELSMHSHQLARGLKHAMIHLPMESSNRQFNTQYKTLFTNFTRSQIIERVTELRRLFPHIHYVNNHTGSVFTAHKPAMKKLYQALRSKGFIFVDSLTAGDSKVGEIARSFGDRYIFRDIFIDNIHDVSYIHRQLKKAVAIAKQRGYAVAIGHPHKVTMQALRLANDILKDVELVYIDELYKRK